MKKLLIVAALLAVAVLIALASGRYLSLEVLVEQEQRLRRLIDGAPARAFGIGLVVYTLVSLFPGTSGKSILCGWFYGFWQSLALVTVSLTLAGLFGFSMARFLFRDALRRRFSRRLDDLRRRLENDGGFYLLTLRMLHVPFTMVNYAAGASGAVGAWRFAWTTFVGLVPSTMIFVGLGSRLPTLAELQHRGAVELLDPLLAAALIAMGALPWVTRLVARRVRGVRILGGARRSIDVESS